MKQKQARGSYNPDAEWRIRWSCVPIIVSVVLPFLCMVASWIYVLIGITERLDPAQAYIAYILGAIIALVIVACTAWVIKEMGW